MKIGVIGVGAVGSACKKGFELLSHEVKVHDPKFNTKIEDVIDTEIVYICVPTPEAEDGSCDLSIVKSSIKELERLIEELQQNKNKALQEKANTERAQVAKKTSAQLQESKRTTENEKSTSLEELQRLEEERAKSRIVGLQSSSLGINVPEKSKLNKLTLKLTNGMNRTNKTDRLNKMKKH
jgi:hypothetical protein